MLNKVKVFCFFQKEMGSGVRLRSEEALYKFLIFVDLSFFRYSYVLVLSGKIII